MRGGRRESRGLGKGAVNGWGQSEWGVNLSRCTQVRFNGGGRGEEGWGHRGHSAGGTGTEESRTAEDPRRDWYSTLREDKLCSVGTDSIGQSMLRGWVFVGGRCGTTVAHGVAALSDRVATGSLDVCSMGNGGGSDKRVLPNSRRADT